MPATSGSTIRSAISRAALGIAIIGLMAAWTVSPVFAADSGKDGEKKDILPDRIVSFVPHATEMLFAIGEGKRVVGVGDSCIWPDETKDLPKLGGAFDSDLEAIEALNPGAVFLSPSYTVLRMKLADRNIRILSIKTDSINDALWLLSGLANDAGIAETVKPKYSRIQEELDALYKEGNKRPSRRVLLCVGHEADNLDRMFMVTSNKNYLDELIRSAGAQNAAILPKDALGREEKGIVAEMTRQQVIEAKPEIVIDLLPGKKRTANERQKTEAMWRDLFSAQSAQPRRIHVVHDPYLGVPGMRIPDSLRKIGRWIYPDL